MYPICIQECAPKIFFHSLFHIFCPKVWACIIFMWAKGKQIWTTLLVVKASILGAVEVLEVFVKS